MAKIKYPKKIIEQRANLERLQHISFDIKGLRKMINCLNVRIAGKILDRIQENFDLIAIDMIGKVRKTDRKKK